MKFHLTQLQQVHPGALDKMVRRRRWEDMDSDCLINIFGRLGTADLALSVPFVCKSWHEESFDPLCWTVLDFRALDFMPETRFASFMKLAVFRSQGLASELMFPLVHGASLEDLVHASNKCTRLKKLVMPRLTLAEEARVPEIVSRWKELEEIEMESKPCCFLEMITQISVNCKSFSGLRMSGLINKEDASAIVELLPRLKSLNLSKSCMSKEELMVIMKGCGELEELVVTDCIGFEVDNEVQRAATGIRRFEYEGSELRVDDDGYASDELDCLHVHDLWF